MFDFVINEQMFYFNVSIPILKDRTYSKLVINARELAPSTFKDSI